MSSGLPFVWQMTAGRCHTLLSPVTEESGEEGTSSEISSPPACRSPSPVANTEASVNQVTPARSSPPHPPTPCCAFWTAAGPYSCQTEGVNPGLWGIYREVWQLHKLWLSCETTPGFTGHLLSRAPGNEMSKNWITEMIAGEGFVLRHMAPVSDSSR